jgi:hypothetical protein
MTYFKKKNVPRKRAILKIFIHKTPNKEKTAQDKEKYLF